MKKTIAWILALCLLAMGIPAMAASSAQPLFTVPEDAMDSLIGFAYDQQQGKIYALGYEQLYTMNEDGSEVQTWEIAPYDLGENEGNGYFNVSGICHWEDGVYVLAGATIFTEDQSDASLQDYGLHTLAFDEEAGTVSLELAMAIDGENLIEYEGDYAYVATPSQPVQMDGKLYGMAYMMNGTSLICLDPAAGSAELLEMDDSTQSILPYKEGKLLAVINEYSDSMTMRVNVLDPATGDMEELFALGEMTGSIYPNPIGYDAQSDAFYYEANGELMRVVGADVEAAASVAACPTSYPNCMAVAADGDLLLSDYETLWKVNINPEERPEARLIVQYNYNSAMEAARVAFQQAHPEVEVVLAQSPGDVVQSMMTQVTTPDIYTLSVSSPEYSAVFGRGYMAELTGSEILSNFAAAVYPAIQEVIQKDGEVYGLPLEAYGFGDLSYSPEAFERLGLTEEDVPANWMEFFDLLGRLPDYLENDPDVTVFETYLTVGDLRYILFSALMDSYMLYISQPENEFSFDTPLFRELMAAFEAVDFEALGASEEGMESIYDMGGTMFYTYGTSFSPYVTGNSPKMLYLGLDEGMQPLVSTDVTVAFVNPFSQNRDLAIEYLEYASEQVDTIMRITMMPGENEPVLNPYFEETLENYDEQIASLETQLLGAEEVDKQALEATLEEMQGYRDDFEKNNRYNASEESIAAYREVAGYIVVSTYLGMDSETSNEYYEQRNQYIDGAITLDEFIRNIDQKLQMIVLEGM